MDTQKIKVILSAIEHKSLSKAAEEISYTPSALSHMADALEQEIGVKILRRTHSGISLTEEGEILYDYMVSLLKAERSFLETAAALAGSKENHLRIGAFSSISQTLLPKIISSFRREHPDIKISVSVDDNLHDWPERDLADIIFTDEHSYGSNRFIPIMEDPFVAVLPSDMLRGKRSVNREELYDHTYISINEKILEDYFDQARFPSVLKFASIDNMSVLYMVQQGLGFSVLPSLMLHQKIEGVRIVKLTSPISRTIGIACKKGVRQSYASKTFIEYLMEMEKGK